MTIGIAEARPVADQLADLHMFAVLINRRKSMAGRQWRQSDTPAEHRRG